MRFSKVRPCLGAANYILAYFLFALSCPDPIGAQPTGKPPAGCQRLLNSDLALTMVGLRSKGFLIDAGRGYISLKHKSRSQHAWARMLGTDLMMLAVYSKGPRGGRIEGFDGHVVFKMFLDYFHPRVKAILGNWEGDSDNLLTFNEFSKSLPLEEAALGTWTGRQAVLHGFDRAMILDRKGELGNFERVAVEFYRGESLR